MIFRSVSGMIPVCTEMAGVARPPSRHKISLMRQERIREYDPKPGVSISTLAYDYPPDYRVPEHAHGAAQLIYATRGVMEVTAGETCWLIPPYFGVWIPACAR